VINANPDIERLRFLVKFVQRETKHLQTTDQRLFELNFLPNLSIAKFIRRETAFMLSMLVLSAIMNAKKYWYLFCLQFYCDNF
jgi:hypothetical protein